MHLMELTRALDIEDHTKVIFHLKMLKDSELINQDKEKSYFLTKGGEKTLNFLNILEGHLST
jgi:predicted transcriptional regulator